MRQYLFILMVMTVGCTPSTVNYRFEIEDSDKLALEAVYSYRVDESLVNCEVTKETQNNGVDKNEDAHHVIQLNRQEPSSWLNVFEASGIPMLSLPIWGVFELFRFVVVEDYDSTFKDTYYDSFLVYENKQDPIKMDEEFEIIVRNLTVDNFTEGRLRDAFGGSGAEISMQVSLNALNKHGQLLNKDTDLLIEKTIKRRSEFLALLGARDKDKKKLEKLNQNLTELFGDDTTRGDVRKAIAAYLVNLNGISGKTFKKGKIDTFISEINEIKTYYANEKDAWNDFQIKKAKAIVAVIDNSKILENWKANFQDLDLPAQRLKAREYLRLQIELIVMKRAHENKKDGKNDENLLLANTVFGFVDRFATGSTDERLKFYNSFLKMSEGKLEVAGRLAARFGVDNKGLYEEVKILQALAPGNKFWNRTFKGIRPSTQESGATLMSVSAASIEEKEFHAKRGQEGLVFRGTIKDLVREDQVADAAGFSLSGLMLEVDDDRLAVALREIEEYAAKRDLKFSASGSEVQVAPLIEAVAIVAEDIARDDVELKGLDIRFVAEGKDDSGGLEASVPGRPVFKLKPCRIILTRNIREGLRSYALNKSIDFDAFAIIEIKRTPKKSN